jgi:hypothetical protein
MKQIISHHSLAGIDLEQTWFVLQLQSAQEIEYFEQRYNFDDHNDNDEDANTYTSRIEKFTSVKLAQFEMSNIKFGFVLFLIVLQQPIN